MPWPARTSGTWDHGHAPDVGVRGALAEVSPAFVVHKPGSSRPNPPSFSRGPLGRALYEGKEGSSMPYLSPPTLTRSEIEAILAVSRTHARDHLIVAISLGTGLRLGEIVGLNVGDVY